MFDLGKHYSREYIASMVGGLPEPYLPQDPAGRVVAVCVRYDLNPDAPDIILPGTGPVIEASAREFCKGYPAPAFIKLAVGEWVFVGNYRVVKHSKDPTVIEQHQKKAELLGRSRKGSDKITQVLDLEPVGDYFDLRDGSGKIKRADRERNSPIPTETVESGSHPFQAAPLAL